MSSRKNRKIEQDRYKVPFPVIRQKAIFVSLNYLSILILIILQFGSQDDHCTEETEVKNCDDSLVDNSILFIITLYYLSCCVRC
jgi:hypothetical protein